MCFVGEEDGIVVRALSAILGLSHLPHTGVAPLASGTMPRSCGCPSKSHAKGQQQPDGWPM